MIFSLHPDAEAELQAGIDYYEGLETGLGYDFSLEVYAAIQRALEFPFAWTLLGDGIRRSLLHRFPYGVVYVLEQERLYVLAVMSLHRKPDYWKERTR